MTSGLSLAVDAVFVVSQSQRRQVQWSPRNPLDEPLLRTLRPYLNHEAASWRVHSHCLHPIQRAMAR